MKKLKDYSASELLSKHTLQNEMNFELQHLLTSLAKSSLPAGEMPISLKKITSKNRVKNSHAIGLFFKKISTQNKIGIFIGNDKILIIFNSALQ